jgi:hypothetical protein
MKNSKITFTVSYIAIICMLFQTYAYASSVRLPSGTRIYVETKEELIGKGDRVQQGQNVRAQVWRDVVVGGNLLIAAGTPVIAKVDHIKRRKIAGVKGSMSIGAYETESVDGQAIQLSGGYNKEGKSRMALSITLGVLFILPIFIPGKAAELPAGTVFDAYVDNSWSIAVGGSSDGSSDGSSGVRTVDLSYWDTDISAELLYEKLDAQEKPKYFEFEIVVPEGAPKKFEIDRINSEPVNPISLKNVSENVEDDELVVNAQVKIKTLIKKFSKGINTIEISSADSAERIATKLIINIEI